MAYLSTESEQSFIRECRKLGWRCSGQCTEGEKYYFNPLRTVPFVTCEVIAQNIDDPEVSITFEGAPSAEAGATAIMAALKALQGQDDAED